MLRRCGLMVLLVGALMPVAVLAAPDQYMQIERGRQLALAGDCVACHTTSGGQPFAGGMILDTPFGGISTPNLTPDEETGLGQWSEDDFARAMQKGVGRDGAHLYPAFPYPYYTKVTREDADAIFAYLRTLPPVRNKVDRDTLPFPFNIRKLMIGWNMLFFSEGQFRPDPQRSAEYTRGQYLVDGLAHCGACHTPMNWAGANRNADYLQGNTLNAWVAPNITDDARVGLGNWSIEDIVTYLKTGRNGHSHASGPMAEVVVNSTSLMHDADLHAMATYLKERGSSGPAAPSALPTGDARMQAGEAVYVDNCSACHKRDGSGIALLFPPVAGNPLVQQADAATLRRIVLTGVQGAATDAAPTGQAMPSFGWRLSDRQVADVLTYIRNSWGNAAGAVTSEDVGKSRAQLSVVTIADHR